MGKRLYILSVVIGLAYGLQAQNSAGEAAGASTPAMPGDMVSVFVSMPDSLTPYLARTMREDMADYFRTGSNTRVSNMLNGNSYIMAADSDMAEISLTEGKSYIALKRLVTAKGDTLFAVIETVSTPARDSRIAFYNSTWQPVKGDKLFAAPSAKDFFKETSSAGAKEALKQINISFTELSFTGAGCIKASFADGIKGYLTEEICKSVTPFLRSEPLYYAWDGKSFRKSSQAACEVPGKALGKDSIK